MISWNITVSGASDPTLNFTYTPASSFIPSLYSNDQIAARFVRTLPGNPPENPFGTNPFDSNSVLLDLDFFDSPGNHGLTDSGGTINVVTGGTQTYQIAQSANYGVESGCVTSVVGLTSCPGGGTPEPGGVLLVGIGGASLLCLFKIRRT